MARPHEDPDDPVLGTTNITDLAVGDKIMLDADLHGITSTGAQNANVTKIEDVEEIPGVVAVHITTIIYIDRDDHRPITVIE